MRTILFASDYGLDDEFVGVCHAVIARTAPGVRVIDLAHGIPAGDVRRGALVLAEAVAYAPEETVFLAVVDPGVGTARRALAVRAGRGLLVGPDNGVLSLAWETLGGVEGAHAVESDQVVLPVISGTFHGRDVFAPAAALLATGLELARVGPAVDPLMLERVPPPLAEVADGRLGCETVGVDRFGNVQLSARPRHLHEAGLGAAATLSVATAADVWTAARAATFAAVAESELAVVTDSWGWLALAVNRGRAADRLGLRPGDRVELGPDDAAR